MGKQQHEVATMPQGEIVERRKALVHNLGMVQKRLLAVLPRQVDKMRFYQVAVSLMGNPEILACEPVSILKAVFTFARLGLDLDSTLGQAYIIPFRDKQAGVTNATVIIGYRGFIELGIRAGLRGVWANVVYANDVFEWDSGSAHELTHKPWWTTGQAEPGEPIAAYCIAEMPSGLRVVHAMPWKKIMEIKVKAQSKAWTTDLEAMALKTPVRHASKFWPQSPGLAMAVSLDEAAEVGAQVLPSDDVLGDVSSPPKGGGWGYEAPGEPATGAPAQEPPPVDAPAQSEHKAAEEPPPAAPDAEPDAEPDAGDFLCPYCNAPYKRESNLKNHLKTKHPKMPNPYATAAPPEPEPAAEPEPEPEPAESEGGEDNHCATCGHVKGRHDIFGGKGCSVTGCKCTGFVVSYADEAEPEPEPADGEALADGLCYTCQHEKAQHNGVGGSCSIVGCKCMAFARDPFEAAPPTNPSEPEPEPEPESEPEPEDPSLQTPQCECGGVLSETAFGFHCPACGSVYNDEMEKQR